MQVVPLEKYLVSNILKLRATCDKQTRPQKIGKRTQYTHSEQTDGQTKRQSQTDTITSKHVEFLTDMNINKNEVVTFDVRMLAVNDITDKQVS